jgi:hypothetical protein
MEGNGRVLPGTHREALKATRTTIRIESIKALEVEI